MRRQPKPIGRPWKTKPQADLHFEILPRFCPGIPFSTDDERVARRAALDERRAYLRCLRGQLGHEERLRAKGLGYCGIVWRWYVEDSLVVVEDASKNDLRFDQKAYESWAAYHRFESARGNRHRPIVIRGGGEAGSETASARGRQDRRGRLKLISNRDDSGAVDA